MCVTIRGIRVKQRSPRIQSLMSVRVVVVAMVTGTTTPIRLLALASASASALASTGTAAVVTVLSMTATATPSPFLSLPSSHPRLLRFFTSIVVQILAFSLSLLLFLLLHLLHILGQLLQTELPLCVNSLLDFLCLKTTTSFHPDVLTLALPFYLSNPTRQLQSLFGPDAPESICLAFSAWAR